MGSSEGDQTNPHQIYPTLQQTPNHYNEQLLLQFDFLLVEASKRNMKLVVTLNNFCNWSGGFDIYKRWSKDTDFYTSDQSQQIYQQFIYDIMNRVNSINNVKYNEDDTIMAW